MIPKCPPEIFSQLRRYGILGGGCLITNLALMWFLMEIVGANLMTTTVICFFALNTFSHHVSRKWIFVQNPTIEPEDPSAATLPYQNTLKRHIAAMLATLLANMVLMHVAVEILNTPYLVASIVIAGTFFMINFSIHKIWTFISKPIKKSNFEPKNYPNTPKNPHENK